MAKQKKNAAQGSAQDNGIVAVLESPPAVANLQRMIDNAEALIAEKTVTGGQAPAPSPDEPEPNPVEIATEILVKATSEEGEALAREQKAQQEAQIALATKILNDGVKAYTNGETHFRTGLLLAGKRWHEYVLARLACQHSRKAAIASIVGKLALVASDEINETRINEQIKAHYAWEFLVNARGLGKRQANVSYGHFIFAFSKLLVCEGMGTTQEAYRLLPGMEDKCVALFDKCVQEGWVRKDASANVDKLVVDYITGLRDSARAERERVEEEQRETARKLDEANKASAEAFHAAKIASDKIGTNNTEAQNKKLAQEAREQEALGKDLATDAQEAKEALGTLTQEQKDAKRQEDNADKRLANKLSKGTRSKDKDKDDPRPEAWRDSLISAVKDDKTSIHDVAVLLCSVLMAVVIKDRKSVLRHFAEELVKQHKEELVSNTVEALAAFAEDLTAK